MAIKDIVIGGKNVKEIRINGGLYFKKRTGKVIYKIEIDYDRANILNPANFTLNGVTESGGVYTFPANGFGMIQQNLDTPIANAEYYGSVDMKVPPNTSFADGRFEYYASDNPGNLLVFTSFFNAIQDNEWHKYSGLPVITNRDGTWILRSFAVNPTNTVYRRNHYITKYGDIVDERLKSTITKEVLDNDLSKPVSQRGIVFEKEDFVVLSGLNYRTVSIDSFDVEILTSYSIEGKVGICNCNGVKTIDSSSIRNANNGEIYLMDVTTIKTEAIGFNNSTAVIHFGNKINNIEGIVVKMNAIWAGSSTCNPIYLHYTENDEVKFDPSLFVEKGIAGETKDTPYTYNFYTDNSIIRNGLLSKRSSATIVNVYHLDGSNW